MTRCHHCQKDVTLRPFHVKHDGVVYCNDCFIVYPYAIHRYEIDSIFAGTSETHPETTIEQNPISKKRRIRRI